MKNGPNRTPHTIVKVDVLDSRLEQLPLGVTFAQHVAWRDMNANNIAPLADRVPEPDAPVMKAGFARAGRTLFVIGTVAPGRTGASAALSALAAERRRM